MVGEGKSASVQVRLPLKGLCHRNETNRWNLLCSGPWFSRYRTVTPLRRLLTGETLVYRVIFPVIGFSVLRIRHTRSRPVNERGPPSKGLRFYSPTLVYRRSKEGRDLTSRPVPGLGVSVSFRGRVRTGHHRLPSSSNFKSRLRRSVGKTEKRG